ncbi:MAG: polysaccharide deacetylase family protein [Clostridiaceae bacterium]|nr:polysaccharide deacetylase family protein [Clostridiaceae bacterium]
MENKKIAVYITIMVAVVFIIGVTLCAKNTMPILQAREIQSPNEKVSPANEKVLIEALSQDQDETLTMVNKEDGANESINYQKMYIEKGNNTSIRNFEIEEKAEAIPVLMYHHLLTKDENPFRSNSAILDVKNFQEQMNILYENNYTTITLYELEQFLLGNLDVPKNTVVITFDDGYLSNIHYAYPILKEYGFVASIFMITHEVHETSEVFNPNVLQYLSYKDMVDTLDVFTYDNHTHNMHRLENGNGYLLTKSSEEIIQDLKINMELTHSPYFAYPYGHYNEETLTILEELGIRMAFTVERGLVKKGDSLLELNRYGIFPNTSLRQFKNIIGLNTRWSILK